MITKAIIDVVDDVVEIQELAMKTLGLAIISIQDSPNGHYEVTLHATCQGHGALEAWYGDLIYREEI